MEQEGTGGSDNEERALIETGELLVEAEKLAMDQALRDLINSGISQESAGSHGDSTAGLSSTIEEESSSVTLAYGSELNYPEAVKALQRILLSAGLMDGGAEYGEFGRKTEAALRGYQASLGLEVSGLVDATTRRAIADMESSNNEIRADVAYLEFFWRTEGIWSDSVSQDLLDRLAKALQVHTTEGKDAMYVKLQRLHRLLPEADVLRMAVQEPEILRADAARTTSNLVYLIQALAGHDVMMAVESFPGVLLLDNLRERVITCMECYKRWSRYSNAAQILAENPRMILRIPDYYRDVHYEDLPMEIQNTMTTGGGGGGTVTWV